MEIRNTTFYNVSALTGDGGAILFEIENGKTYSLLLEGSTF